MSVNAARIVLHFERGSTRIQSARRNPRGVHYLVEEITVYQEKMDKKAYRDARKLAIETLLGASKA